MIYNFGAGPAMLPRPVIEQLKEELAHWHGGMSVLEISHRSKAFQMVAERSEACLRELLNIPDDYYVLFLQGGGRAQFSMVPMNLVAEHERANYAITGHWSKVAYEDASQFVNIDIAVTNEPQGSLHIPPQKEWQLNPDAIYLHYTDNETVNGLEFSWTPKTKAHLVADMSSNLLSKPIDVCRYALIYASAQKNIGPAGLTLVIVHADCLKKCQHGTPALYDYRTYITTQSMPNTPPTFSWYVTSLVLDWLLAEGGLKEIAKRNARKAKKLYDYIDQSDFYHNQVEKHSRSKMNIPFQLSDPSLESTFLMEAEHRGLMQLAGHRKVGGLRASIYNAMPEEGVDALIAFMEEFADTHCVDALASASGK